MTDKERGFYERNISYIRAVLFEDLNVLLYAHLEKYVILSQVCFGPFHTRPFLYKKIFRFGDNF